MSLATSSPKWSGGWRRRLDEADQAAATIERAGHAHGRGRTDECREYGSLPIDRPPYVEKQQDEDDKPNVDLVCGCHVLANWQLMIAGVD